MRQDFIVDPGIGQGPGGQLVATGTFTAPATPGSYSFLLANGVANVLTAVNPPPQHSPTESASVDVTGGVMSFIVCLPGDVNGDFVVTTDDVGHFVSALLDPMGEFASCAADVNGDGNVDGKDIQHFVDALLA